MPDTWRALKTLLLEQGGIGAIFAHLRNLVMATVIIAAGAYAIRHPRDVELFGLLNLEIAGLGVTAIGFVLVGLNLLDGLYKLTTFGISLGFRIALIILYLLFTLRLIQFIVLLRAG